MIFKRFFSRSSEDRLPRLPAGMRVYAVGDIHGRLDLLQDLLVQIDEDMARNDQTRTIIVFLGDVVDRGPQSREVIESLRRFDRSGVEPVFLLGNHEEVLLRILAGERNLVDGWLKYGGAELLESYGVSAESLRSMSGRRTIAAIREAIPLDHVRFLESFADTLKIGDYLFVHAGIRPDVDLSLQLQSDLRWIRQPFLESDTDHGCVVVHGHTIEEEVIERPNRLGIDTGAYRTGVLTAAVLEGTSRRFLATSGPASAGRRSID
ncbi:metallophosphoesterase [Sphingomonas sp. LY29]|uniref:metallophosphoesterase n=1 Tax=Sphingomonas sp. LY29 TaxID=3095341 RepID=UPI002D778D38|nr:metallophosphoesterase [Sphingomonas sp. LY29]WRP26248.1 metallophosphoesterase [Sphingomonas sp. LY29]